MSSWTTFSFQVFAHTASYRVNVSAERCLLPHCHSLNCSLSSDVQLFTLCVCFDDFAPDVNDVFFARFLSVVFNTTLVKVSTNLGLTGWESMLNRTDTKRPMFLVLLVRKTSYSLVVRPIGCFGCTSCPSLLATAMHLQVEMAAPAPNSCPLATRTCISYLATSLLHSTCCGDSILRTSNQHDSMLYFWTCSAAAPDCSAPSCVCRQDVSALSRSATRGSDAVSVHKTVIFRSSTCEGNASFFSITIHMSLADQPLYTGSHNAFLIVP